jgi:Putative peptidoglycan binding domain/CHAP domain
MSRQSLLQHARAQIGYVEQPVNRTKYGRQFGMDGVFWCMQFVWACFENSGNRGLVPKTASTRALFAAAKRGDIGMKFMPATGTPIPGDLVEFDMGGPEPVNHIGIVERLLPDGRLVCIEGNTGGRGPDGERNGGMVARKNRSRGQVVNFVRPRFASDGGVPPPGRPRFPGTVIKRGAQGETVKRIQARLNAIGKGRHHVLGGKPIPVGGHFGPKTEMVVKVFQKNRGLLDDGEVGRDTWARLFG